MQNGDISNSLPQRILVTIDVITDVYEDKAKKWRVVPTIKKRTEYNRLVLSHLYMVSLKRGYTLELISYIHDEDELQKIMIYLDEFGTNPFRYASAYKNVDKLVDELPYRPEIIGVIDTPARLLRYGRWGLDFPSL